MSPAEIFNMLNVNNQNSSSSNEEKQQVKYRINVGYYETNEQGELKLIALPFGIALELSEKQRRNQFPKSLGLMDQLAQLASKLDEGESIDLIPPQEGQFGIQLRHVAKSQTSTTEVSCSALDALKKSLECR